MKLFGPNNQICRAMSILTFFFFKQTPLCLDWDGNDTALIHQGSVLIITALLLLMEYMETVLSDISFVFFSQTVWFMSLVGWLSWGCFPTAPLINSALFSDRQLCPQMDKTAMCFMVNFTRGRIYWSIFCFILGVLPYPSIVAPPPSAATLITMKSFYITHSLLQMTSVCVCGFV